MATASIIISHPMEPHTTTPTPLRPTTSAASIQTFTNKGFQAFHDGEFVSTGLLAEAEPRVVTATKRTLYREVVS